MNEYFTEQPIVDATKTLFIAACQKEIDNLSLFFKLIIKQINKNKK